MQFGKTKIILLAGLVAVSMAAMPLSAKKNIFKRSGSAIKEFFSGDNFSSDQLTFSGYLEPYNSFLYQGHSLK